MDIEHGYWGIKDLLARGWTRGLIARHLGQPERLFAVDHWLNWSGKHAWRWSTVELVEMTQGFEKSFLHSARVRRLTEHEAGAVIDRIYTLRERGLTSEPVETDPVLARLNACANSAAALFEEARRRGYRTPHKC